MRGQELVHPELLHLARAVRRDGIIREAELTLQKGIGDGRLVVAARVAPLGADHVLLLVEDRSKAARVEEIRRDFLANVSHELKTPVGGISLLAEAVLDAHDDPEAVARFARRISVESDRLTRLVKEIVELSRLQGADVIKDPDPHRRRRVRPRRRRPQPAHRRRAPHRARHGRSTRTARCGATPSS